MISPTTTDAALLIPPPMALPAPSALLTLLQVLTFFGHLVLVNILLGSVMLAILDRRAAIPDEKNGVAFMPKTLALAVNFAIAPFLFLQVLYGNHLYTSIILMTVWWLALVPAVMLAYYGLYLSDSEIPVSRRTVLIPTALLLLAAAFLLTSASTLMQRPDQWLHWFSAPHGMLLNLGDATLFPRYLHIVLASLAAGGLTMAWRADRSLRHPETDVDEALWRRRRGLAWFFHTSLAQIAAGLLFLFTQPASIRALFLGGSFLHTAALILAAACLIPALFMARRGCLGLTSAAALGVILVMVCNRFMIRDAMLQPYHKLQASVSPAALAMPHGQSTALAMFLICAVLSIPVLVWLIRVVLHALRSTGALPQNNRRAGAEAEAGEN